MERISVRPPNNPVKSSLNVVALGHEKSENLVKKENPLSRACSNLAIDDCKEEVNHFLDVHTGQFYDDESIQRKRGLEA